VTGAGTTGRPLGIGVEREPLRAPGLLHEFPAFIPSGQEQVASVITVPPGRSRAIVVLTTGGGGAPRSHAGSMWTRVARGLAARGIASARMDWRGMGDSTGSARFPAGFANLPVEDLGAVAGFARQVTGAEALGVAGNCGGARTALAALEALGRCESLALLLVKAAARIGSEGPMALRARLLLSRVPVFERAARRTTRAVRSIRTDPAASRILRANRSAHVLVLEDRTAKAGNLIPVLSAASRGNGTRRLEPLEMPVPWSRGFDAVERQDFVVTTLIEWFDQTLP